MNLSRSVCALIVVSVCPSVHAASGGESVLTHHAGSGGGSAQLYDGGEVDTASFFDPGSLNPHLGFSAVDISSQPGVFSAAMGSSGDSKIHFFEDEIFVTVNLTVSYGPSSQGGGDNPGGMGEGQLSSVIEFMNPVDSPAWTYILDIDDSPGFDGSSSILIENVTQNTTLVSLADVTFGMETTLAADAGDIIRITSEMEGAGDTGGPSGFRRYEADFQSLLLIPEPSTGFLLLTGLFAFRRRRCHR
jgi:hypothetical protein